jgi:ParB/RepB/Spo0J family partition protein
MTTTTDVTASDVRMIALDQIRHDSNIREHDPAEVDALAGSIELLGQITPAIVRPDGQGYVLVAGHKRYAALVKLSRSEIRAEIRTADAEHSERAAENIVRSQLNPYEEARAVQAMLAKGLSEDGAAQALGWPKMRVTARIRLLALPERAQEMVGAGTIALSAVEQLLAIGQGAPELLDAVIDYLADGNERAAERLMREPGWVLDAAIRDGDRKVFAEHLAYVNSHEVAELRLGKKTEQLLEQAAQLHKQLDRYAYSGPTIRFAEIEVDQARAAGVLIEFERSSPIIVDRPLYRELCKQAIKRTVGELEAKVAQRAAEKKSSHNDSKPQDPFTEADRTERQAVRELSEQAHGVNIDLGLALMSGLSTIDPESVDVARFFAYSLLGTDYDSSPYTQTGERVAKLAASGIRLVIEPFRTDVTKIKKDGSRGVLRIDYGEQRDPAEPIKWLWKFVDGAKTAGEIYGRALVVICAEKYASRLVVPQSQRSQPTRWGSHKDLAEKALSKLAGPHLPATLKQLERAVDRAHKDAERSRADARKDTSETTAADSAVDHVDGVDADEFSDEDLDDDLVEDVACDVVDSGGALEPDVSIDADADPEM